MQSLAISVQFSQSCAQVAPVRTVTWNTDGVKIALMHPSGRCCPHPTRALGRGRRRGADSDSQFVSSGPPHAVEAPLSQQPNPFRNNGPPTPLARSTCCYVFQLCCNRCAAPLPRIVLSRPPTKPAQNAPSHRSRAPLVERRSGRAPEPPHTYWMAE
jgi:hypothetical protein